MISTASTRHGQRGFSLLELLVVVAILTTVMGVIFSQIGTAQKRFKAEEAKADLTEESREFLDLLVRDLHQVGYPSMRMYQPDVATGYPPGQIVAVGWRSYSPTDLWFEGDVDGDGQVDVVRYTLQADGGSCPCQIRRSQVLKSGGGVTDYRAGLDDVVNSGGTLGVSGTSPVMTSGGTVSIVSNNTLYGALATAPLFQAFDDRGNVVNATADPDTLATIRSIRVNINLLAKPGADLQTLIRPALSMSASARISPY